MGASGAGKTSLLQLLAGECRNGRVSGSLMVNNEKFTNAARMKKISGFVFQGLFSVPAVFSGGLSRGYGANRRRLGR